jgi:hypothetical protein
VKIAVDIAQKYKESPDEAQAFERSLYKYLFENDLFFIVYFVFKNPAINCKFGIEACQEVENGPKDMTLDIWAREHFKSTVVTLAESLQFIGTDPESACCIISATRKLAKQFLRSLKDCMEKEAVFLNFVFPEVVDGNEIIHRPRFWVDPERQAPLWGLDDGLILPRQTTRKEPSFYAAGLEEGMPTGCHYHRLVFDDITNEDVAQSPLRMKALKKLFDSAQNIGLRGGHRRVVGTYYHYADPLVYVRNKNKINSDIPLYHVRVKAATHDGTPNGIPVFLSQEELDIKKTESTFYCQQLCDPVPAEERKLPGVLLQDIAHVKIPKNLIKLMTVDPAGDENEGKGDDWAMFVIGVSPNTDDFGASDFYILDGEVDKMSEAGGPNMITEIYIRNGRVEMLGIEKVGLATTGSWVEKALMKKGRRVSLASKNMMPLTPKGRKKTRRISDALSWPMLNGKMYISESVPKSIRDRIRQELDEFPYGSNDDAIDAIAYLVGDMMADEIVKAKLRSHTPTNTRMYGHLQAVSGGKGWLRS